MEEIKRKQTTLKLMKEYF